MGKTMEWQNLRLSPHFSLFELCRSDEHPHLVRPPNAVIQYWLTWWAREVLEPLRARIGPIRINSGWRNPELNRAVGGEKRSIHQVSISGEIVGVATDIVPLEMPLADALRVIASMPELPIRGCIIYPKRGFLHTDSRQGDPRFFESPSKGVYLPLSRDAIRTYRIAA